MRAFLGFDGGGTKTECVMLDEHARVVGTSKSGPSNPTRIGFASAAKAVEQAADLALTQAGARRDQVVAICAGLAGTGKDENRDHMKVLLSAAFPGAVIEVLTDLELPLAAIDPGPAMVLVAGTGSAAIGRDAQGNIARAGGFGRDVSDEGSAYDVGRSAVELAAQQQSAAGKDSRLGLHILSQLGCRHWAEVREKIAADRDAVYPRIFPVVAAAADGGDESARALLANAAQKLAALVRDLSGQLRLAGAPFALVKTGGMIGRSTCLDQLLEASLAAVVPDARAVSLRVPPAETAARLAFQSAPRSAEKAL